MMCRHSWGEVNERENRSKINIQAESREEADRIFAGLSVGGEVEGRWVIVPGGVILVCSGTNMVLSGLLNITGNQEACLWILG